jgi:hypothetical protein
MPDDSNNPSTMNSILQRLERSRRSCSRALELSQLGALTESTADTIEKMRGALQAGVGLADRVEQERIDQDRRDGVIRPGEALPRAAAEERSAPPRQPASSDEEEIKRRVQACQLIS